MNVHNKFFWRIKLFGAFIAYAMLFVFFTKCGTGFTYKLKINMAKRIWGMYIVIYSDIFTNIVD